jgi:hypothetical protein
MDLGRTRQELQQNGALLALKSRGEGRESGKHVGQTVVKISFTTVE